MKVYPSRFSHRKYSTRRRAVPLYLQHFDLLYVDINCKMSFFPPQKFPLSFFFFTSSLFSNWKLEILIFSPLVALILFRTSAVSPTRGFLEFKPCTEAKGKGCHKPESLTSGRCINTTCRTKRVKLRGARKHGHQARQRRGNKSDEQTA